MKKIVILDTWTNNTNLGNKIIVESVYKALREIFPHDFFYQVPALEYIQGGRDVVEHADYVFLAGTNQLSSDMERTSEWCAEPTEPFWMNKVILMGLGWWQYQPITPNPYTRFLLNHTLSREYSHALRDSYTAKKMYELGFKVLNTGCPTLWWLSKEHCASIPQEKSDKALLTFTEYNTNPKDDKLLFEILRKNYSTVYFWSQMYNDYYYAKGLCGDNLVFIDPSLEALDDLLSREQIDYIGTRLHGGIRALQHKRRSIIIAFDNRTIEMGKDFNLPCMTRREISLNLETNINKSWKTLINLDQEAINIWKNQFKPSPKNQNTNTDSKSNGISVGRWAANKFGNKNSNKLTCISPSDASIDWNIHQAVIELNYKNDTQALSFLEKAIADHPDMAELNYGKAIALVRLGHPNEAIEVLNYLLKTRPEHRKAQLLLNEIRPGKT